MIALIRKDFIASWFFQLCAIAGVMFATTFGTILMVDDGKAFLVTTFAGIATLFCTIAAFVFIMTDDSARTSETFASLPVPRSSIVTARYVTAVVQVLICMGSRRARRVARPRG